jgi:hypothetical protein
LFANIALREIFVPKGEEGTREWRKLHTEELDERSVLLANCCSGDQLKNNEICGGCSTYGEEKRFIQGLVR